MKTLTKILGTLTILGALAAGTGAVTKNDTAFAVGAAGTAVCGVGYVLAKSKEEEQDNYTKKDKLNYK